MRSRLADPFGSAEAHGGQQQEPNADSRVTIQVPLYLLQAWFAGTEKESLALFFVRLLPEGRAG